MQTVLFITDRCNLRCKHCSVYQTDNIHTMSFGEIRNHLEYSYGLGSRFLDIEGGETTLWKDGDKNLNDVIGLAKQIGFFSVTITTNAQQDISWIKADSLWVSMDGVGNYHDRIRGEGSFARLEKNIANSNLKHLSVNMVVNKLNYESMEDALDYARRNPAIEQISLNFHTPFPGTEYLALDTDTRSVLIDKVLELKRKGFPIMNSHSGLQKMKHVERLQNRCWVTNFIYPDGTRGHCAGMGTDICKQCGFCMAGEMASVFNFCPDTILAGLKLRK
ncbi:MAG: radical SAM protein [Paludibacter sp.]|nr:radical SAM protein [Bacteroidales bacterium]MCM1069962.1 radical SAM protein [Prevotella sp.]MCM1354552.1 radical SAM protein [Bacteroides sp.]MCM1443563.1 radical SAM protein [Muribaculum sp.]MCM1482635.1 radical SAM protein [Paludibacter sp.]